MNMMQISLALLSLLLNSVLVSSQSGATTFSVGLGNGPNVNANENANANASDETPAAAPVTNAPVAREINEDDMVLFTLSFGFDEGFEREPTQEEMEELLCISDDFLRRKLAQTVDNSQLFSVNIEWKYDVTNGLDPEDASWSEGKSYPISMTFFLDTTYADGQGTRIPKDIVFGALEFSKEEIITFITDDVWTVSRSSVFYDTMRAHYNLSQARWRGERTIMLPEAPNCPATRMPTWAPDVPSASPTISPAPTALATLSPEESDDLVYFQLEVDLEQSAEEVFEEPSREEVKALMCVVNSFIRDRLAEHMQDPSLATAVTNIRWITSSSTERTGITLFFTTDTDLQGQDPVPTETITQVLQDINEELLDFLHSEGALIYLEDEEINPLLELPTSVNLDSLPPDYPVRTGAMDVYAENCTAYDHSDNGDDGNVRVGALSFLDDTPDGNATDGESVGGGSPQLSRGDVTGSGQGNDGDNNDTNNDGDGDGNNDGDDGEGGNQNGAGSVSIGQGTPTKLAIDVQFVVSNLDDISDPDEVKHLGLARTWPDFTKDVVTKKTAATYLRGRRALQEQSSTPVAEYVPYSALISKISSVDCGEHTMAGLTCHQVEARYEVTARALDIRSQDEDLAEAKRFYQVATYQGIIDGTYNSVLKNTVPGTPLYIGTIPDHGFEDDDNKGMIPWWVILLLCLLFLCCLCCILAALCWRERNRKEAEQEEVILSEKVVTNHRSWEPKDEDDDNTEIFANDDIDIENDPPEQCQMLVPYTGGTDWQDDDSSARGQDMLVPYNGGEAMDELSNHELCGSSFRRRVRGSSFRESTAPTKKSTHEKRKRTSTVKANKGVVA